MTHRVFITSLHITTTNLKSQLQIENDEFDLPDGSYSISGIQDYFEYILKKQETIANSPPMHIYVNKIKNRIVFKLKAGYKLELLSPDTRKLLVQKNMFIRIKMEKIYQNQNFLKLLKQHIVIQSIKTISKHLKYWIHIKIINKHPNFCTQSAIWAINYHCTSFINNVKYNKHRILIHLSMVYLSK